MKIKPKLYLNMSPQTAEHGSLAFARNMKIDDDGNLVSDYGYTNINTMRNHNIVGHIVGLDDKIYFFCHNPVGDHYVDLIVEYNESTRSATTLATAHWTYSGGEIDGYVSTNQSGEKILTVAEYKEGENIPLKHINLTFRAVGDESFYCQAPACPTANLVIRDTYVKTIPNGVYVFFIRYKIRKDVYTNWFLCSRPIFGGTSEKITTLQGGLNYINTHKDSAKSFVLQLNFSSVKNKSLYSEFQLGFIITHDEATDARVWKHFNIGAFADNPASNQNLIYFDYEDVKDANIDDLIENTYELYNVRNVTSFKNKLYISNYVESNFNPEEIEGVDGLKKYITLSVAHTKDSSDTELNYKSMRYDRIPLKYNYSAGYYDKTDEATPRNIKNIIDVSDFNFNATPLSKIESKEKADVARFDVFWNGAIDPDIALVYNIYNDLHNKVIFGPDWLTPIPETYAPSGSVPDKPFAEKLAKVGLRLIDNGTNAYVYQPLYNAINNSNHPWYNLGLTFGFGSYKADEVGTPNYKLGCSLFNAYTYNYESSYISGHDPLKFGWFTRDSGFADFARSTIENTIQREIEGRSFFAKAYIEITSGANIYTIGHYDAMDLDNYAGDNMSFSFFRFDISKPYTDYRENSWKYYTDNHLTVLNPELFSSSVLTTGLYEQIKTWAYSIINNRIVGIDDNGTVVLDVGTEAAPIIVRVNNIAIKFKKFDFTVDNESIDTTDGHYVKRFKISLKTTDYVSLCTFFINNSCISVTDNGMGAIQQSTLMPLSTYQPYVHFVDEHNIITNGVKLSMFTTGLPNKDDDILYLKYNVSDDFPGSEKWKSFFISLVNVGDIVIEGFNYIINPNNKYVHIIHSIEIDSMLYNINDNITIEIYNKTTGGLTNRITNAKYNSSGSTYPPLAFGNCGYISWEEADIRNYENNRFFIKITRNTYKESIDRLVKASSYIPLKVTENPTDLPDGYYSSWLSFVKKPSFELSSSCYVSGRDVYAANRSTILSLTEFKNFIQVQDSITYFIRSNFNLNYLSLTEDIADSIFSVGGASSGVKQVAKVINSATLSFIYELKSMYKDFFNKYFRKYDTDYKIKFDNTIRVSNVLSDETFNNSVFTFKSTDYYNVPTDRGIIVNLFSISNNIFVHTETSFYKFDGNQTISASNTDITLQESEPFESGITQLFDSEYGYGGIYNKEAGCITFDSYIFYDAMSNHIFAYGGNSQIQLIDASIYKLLCYYKPTYCRTLHDDANHRVFFEFTTNKTSGTYKTFTISYNYKSKSFVSLHDLSLVNAFHSRYLSYSYRNGLCSLFTPTSAIDNTVLDQAMNIYKIYGEATTICFIQFGADTQQVQSSPFNIAVVMFPQESYREVFNNVKYIGDIIQDNYDEKTNYELINFHQITRTNPVSKFYIITDRCVSTPVIGNVNDATRPANPDDYKGFKYDMGSWNSNYFRNAINDTNIYQYPNQPGVNEPIGGGQVVTRHPNTDNNSLVYGKYFILVFDFIKNQPIKFEELSVNSNQY